ncbi:MAG: redoxin domain-containing protein [Thiobacillus sp.]|nr:redoxin domain-containing protein [Thiobacillus sp.]
MRPQPAISRVLAVISLATGLIFFPLVAPGLTGKTIPFAFNDLDGNVIRLADFRGQWVLVSFWAPWCPLCKIEIPALNNLDRRPDLTVLSIGLDYDSPDALRAAAAKFDSGLRVIAGGKRRDPNSPHRQVGPVDFFPTAYLYDPTGEIAMYIPGQLNANKVLAFMANWRGDSPVGPAVAAAARTDKLAAFVKQKYGRKGEQAYADWRQMVDRAAAAGTTDKLALANDFFNRRLLLSSDQRIWGRADYWASLGEVLGKGMGDSEDFVIAKYFTLLAMNVPAEHLRLVYVRTRNTGDPVHMVLAYFEQLDREPVLLDNRETEIVPASQRTDLRPVFSFNGIGAWGNIQELPDASGDGRLPLWEDVLLRARTEGFD